MPKLNSPCYRCVEGRSATCHSTCKRYKDWKAEMSERQALKAQAKNDGGYKDYIHRSIVKHQKGKNHKRKGTQ